MKLQRVVEILEINPEKVNIHSLSKIKVKAIKRWHPDTIYSKKPTKEKIELYNNNFQSIEEAIESLKLYIETGVTEDVTKLNKEERIEPEDPVDVIKRNVPEMQQDMEKVWESVKNDNFKHTQKKIILSNGIDLSELLKNDIKDYVPFTAVNVWFFFTLVAVLLNSVITAIIPGSSYIVGNILGVYVLIHLVICILWGLPLSRIWLHKKTFYTFNNYINGHDEFIAKIDMIENDIIGYILAFLFIFPFFVHYVICAPLYYIVALLLSNKKFGVVEKSINFYAGLSDVYISLLMYLSVDSFSDEMLFDLVYIHKEFMNEYHE